MEKDITMIKRLAVFILADGAVENNKDMALNSSEETANLQKPVFKY